MVTVSAPLLKVGKVLGIKLGHSLNPLDIFKFLPIHEIIGFQPASVFSLAYPSSPTDYFPKADYSKVFSVSYVLKFGVKSS